MSEYNFDGLVGPTHSYAGLAQGNLASMSHAGFVSNPRAAALQGLRKMQRVQQLGVPQAVLPPHERPALSVLRRLGFAGDDAAVLVAAAQHDNLLALCSSASAMWTANAATVAPAPDTLDGRTHLTPANLSTMFHRSLEAETTTRVLRTLFADETLFCVHDPLPPGAHFCDEGAANHTRLCTTLGTRHLFGWGKRTWGPAAHPRKYPARQSREASEAIARLHRLQPGLTLLWQQSPGGIDGGAFHSDVLCVGNQNCLLLHEHAFLDQQALLTRLRQDLGDELCIVTCSSRELSLPEAVAAYPFNSQLLSKPDGKMALVAPSESRERPAARAFLERVLAEATPVDEIVYLDVNASMNNGGGPACLRLRVELSDPERVAVRGRVFLDDTLFDELTRWVELHYRDRLTPSDLADPQFTNEIRTALDELSQLLQLGSIYPFQLASH